MTKEEYKKQKRSLKKEYSNKLEEVDNKYISDVSEVVKFDMQKEAPYRYTIEEIGNAISHGVGSLFAIVALVLMLIQANNKYMYIASIIYFVGLFMMFTMSCLYHSFPYGSKVKHIFRRFDYCSIYLLIGSTFAPILLLYIGGTYGVIFLIIQWVLIVLGITMIAVFGPGKLKWLHMPLYLILGWSALLFIPRMIKHDLVFFLIILAGGVIYTLGIIPFTIDKKVSHFLWHIFVFFGAVIQWIGIYIFLYL